MADMTMTSYDVMPYRSGHFSLSHPERLATVARLFGMRPQAVDRCRVLELGCASGGNIIPMAFDLPESRFVGIDLSARQIADGQNTIKELGLGNVQLKQLSIMDVDASLRRFDYIIAHGVYSWVPRDVQERILALCSRHLTPNGVAYLSYNTYPGWAMQGQIRDMLCYFTNKIADPAERMRAARAVLELLGRTMPPRGDSAFALLVRQILEHFRRHGDNNLFHEFLEDVNDPVYFQQLVDRAVARGLQYVGEARVFNMSLASLAPELQEHIRTQTSDFVQQQQCLDFFSNRQFRQSLFCLKDVVLDRTRKPECLRDLHVACFARPAEANPDIHSAAVAQFHGPVGTLSTGYPLLKAALLCLTESWPRSVPFAELCALAHARLAARVPGSVAADQGDDSLLAGSLLNAHFDTGIVELHAHAGRSVAAISDRPRASASARFLARSTPRIANVYHEPVEIDQVDHHLLHHLDGNHDRAALFAALSQAHVQGRLVIQDASRAKVEGERLRPILNDLIDGGLRRLARDGFLVG